MARSDDSSRSVERAARNEAAFRGANRELEQRRQELGVEGERFPFLCECEVERCTELILVRLHEYQAARDNPRHFLVMDGHDPNSRVVSRHDGFVVVEKDGREGEIVEELDG
jgi:hypothetical protein